MRYNTVYLLFAAICCCLCSGCRQEQSVEERHSDTFVQLYNQGQIFDEAGDFQQAMRAYMEAEQHAARGADARLLGELYGRIGAIYNRYCDYAQSLSYYQKAYRHFISIGEEYLQNRTLCDISALYIAMGKYTDAAQLLTLTNNWAILADNDALQEHINELLADLYGRFDAHENMRQVTLPAKQSVDYVYRESISFLALRSAHERKLAAVEHYLRMAWAEAENALDSLDMYSVEYTIQDILGNSRAALESYRKMTQMQNMRMDTIMRNPIQQVRIEYLQRLSDMRMEQLRQKQTINMLITTVACVVILLLVIISVYQRRLRKAAVDNYMVEVQTLQQRIRNRESVISDMNEQIVHSSASVEQMGEQIKTLFKRQFALLDSLVNTYYETRDINRDKEAIYKQVKDEIAKLSSPKSVAELEAIINRHRNNVIADIRTKYPSLSEQNITLLCYILAGFSAKSIGILLDCSIANVHTKRSRLKHQLMEMDAASGEKFSEILN